MNLNSPALSINSYCFQIRILKKTSAMILNVCLFVQGAVGVYELEKLQPEVTSLCSRISKLDCRDAKDR